MEKHAENEKIRWRNFMALLGDSIFFYPAVALFEPTTTIPLLIDRLTGSSLLVGLVGTLRLAGLRLPALPIANLVKHRERKKPWVLYGCLGRILVGLLGVALLVSKHLSDQLLVGLVLFTHLFFWLGDGIAALTWTDIVGKCIPEDQRGRFFGLGQSFGNLAAFGVGFLVKWILDNDALVFPTNYGILFVSAFVLFMVSMGSFILVKEPPGEVYEEAEPFMQFIRRLPEYLRKDPVFVQIVGKIILIGLGGLALPFYVLYAKEKLGLPGGVAGYFISAQTLGMVVGGGLWGYLGDTWGHKRTLGYVGVIQALAPVAALLAALAPGYAGRLVIMLVSYVLLGMGQCGWIVGTNSILETVTPEDRTVYLALSSTLQAPLFLAPFVGGLLVVVGGYTTVFILAAVLPALAKVRAIPEVETAQPSIGAR
ncbi:MAG: MFS transporter [Firmicutes bacterium]|nr:MFS transporter [Bacillota bacterium]